MTYDIDTLYHYLLPVAFYLYASTQVSLRTLMRDAGAVVRGTYTMRDPSAAATAGGMGVGGTGGHGLGQNIALDFACRWVDLNVDAAKRAALFQAETPAGLGLTSETFYALLNRISCRFMALGTSPALWFDAAVAQSKGHASQLKLRWKRKCKINTDFHLYAKNTLFSYVFAREQDRP